jgi:hypothetical protein
MWLYLAPALSLLLGVLVGYWLARPRMPKPLPLGPIANLTPPTMAEIRPGYLFAEPAACDYFTPASGDVERSAAIHRLAAEWYGITPDPDAPRPQTL